MQNIAAIDMDSNAMAVNRVDDYDGKLETIEKLRLPVRLGQVVFSGGQIGRGSR